MTILFPTFITLPDGEVAAVAVIINGENLLIALFVAKPTPPSKSAYACCEDNEVQAIEPATKNMTLQCVRRLVMAARVTSSL
jgi:hypothetical protein